jgi:hypothetical protein
LAPRPNRETWDIAKYAPEVQVTAFVPSTVQDISGKAAKTVKRLEQFSQERVEKGGALINIEQRAFGLPDVERFVQEDTALMSVDVLYYTLEAAEAHARAGGVSYHIFTHYYKRTRTYHYPSGNGTCQVFCDEVTGKWMVKNAPAYS